MKVVKTKDRHTLLLELDDSLESDYAARIDGKIDNILETDVKNIIFDLSKAVYVDSTGLRILVKSLKRLAENGGRAILAVVGEHVRHTLDILGMAGFFTMKDTVGEALKELNTELESKD